MSAVIVLNRNYEYWTEVSLKKVLKWIVKDKIEIVVSDDSSEVGSTEFRIKMPLVVRLLEFIGYKPKYESIPYSQEAVFQRDNNVCQYWHNYKLDEHRQQISVTKYKHQCTIEDRTIDHVLPISRGGKSTFDNTICACRTCNEIIKKNRTPYECNLELIRKPFIPKRDKNSYVSIKFTFNPKKNTHKIYREVILGIL